MTDPNPSSSAWSENDRLAALARYAILDTPPEPAYDDIVSLLADMLDAPIAVVNLIAEGRQWFKAETGLGVKETPLGASFCAHAILQPDGMVIPDARLDQRFKCNPLVTGEPGLRFYAGELLQTPEGLPLGTLCVLDTKPRPQGLSDQQRFLLKTLAGQVMTNLELRRSLMQREEALALQYRQEQALRQSEAAVRETAERYGQALTAGAILGTWTMDLRTGVIRGDDALATAFRIEPEAFQAGVPIERLVRSIHPDDAPRLGVRNPEVMAVAGPYHSEYRLGSAEDGWRWAETNGRIEHDAEGLPLRAFGVVIDSHSRKTNELRQAALLALGDSFREFDNVDAISLAAAEAIGRMLDADRTGYARIDTDAGQIIVDRDWTNGSVPSIIGVHPLHAFGRLMHRISSGEPLILRDVEQETWLQDDIDNLRALDIRSLIDVPLLSHGRLVGLAFANTQAPRIWLEEDAAFVRDVADRTWAAISRVEAEQALKQAARDLEQEVVERTHERDLVWRSSQDLFVICGVDGFYRSVNPAWEDALGYTSDELRGTRFDALIHPDDLAIVHNGFSQVLAGTSVRVEDIRCRHKNGAYRWYSWYAVPDQRDLFYAAGRDVTDRRHLEEQLRQSQKMEAIGQLTGGIAHDFNNLLHGMLGNLEIMKFRLALDGTTDVSRYINAAIEAANRSAALTHRLLAFSRRQTLDPKPTDANALIIAMEELINRTTGPAIRLQTVLAPQLWNTLCDPNQLENALLNLIINARDALPDGGRIMIDTGNVILSEDDLRGHADVLPGDFVKIGVSDNGTGMTAEVVRRAVDPFFTTKPIGQGTGLGLSMIYGFVKQSHGHLRLHSEPGQGTTVQLYLPRHEVAADHGLAAAASLPSPAAPVPESEGARLTILLVDDEDVVRKLLTEAIDELGYATVSLEDGTQALEVVKSTQQIDLLITDVGLPGNMNGCQLAHAARHIRPDLKVLFITGFAENAALDNGMMLAGAEVMTKPFTMTAFAAKIGGMLGAG